VDAYTNHDLVERAFEVDCPLIIATAFLSPACPNRSVISITKEDSITKSSRCNLTPHLHSSTLISCLLSGGWSELLSSSHTLRASSRSWGQRATRHTLKRMLFLLHRTKPTSSYPPLHLVSDDHCRVRVTSGLQIARNTSGTFPPTTPNESNGARVLCLSSAPLICCRSRDRSPAH
jgi:hypothetical protein